MDNLLKNPRPSRRGEVSCVINYGVGAWYPKGQVRLRDSLKANGFDGSLLFLSDSVNWIPNHRQVPYAFKPFLFNEARKSFDLVLWLDASFWAIKRVDELFAEIEKTGHVFEHSGYKTGQWISDDALSKFNMSRDEAFEIDLFSGGCVGLNFKSTKANLFLDRWLTKAVDGSFNGSWSNNHFEVSNDLRVRGHRHDMAVGSIIASQLGMGVLPGNSFWSYFEWYEKYKNDSSFDTSKICLLAQGM